MNYVEVFAILTDGLMLTQDLNLQPVMPHVVRHHECQ